MAEYQKYINALRKCAKEHDNDRTSTGHIIVSDLCKDTANLLEELEQEPRWIPVSERLPEEHGGYLVSLKQGYVTTAFWSGNSQKWEKITAWMPLPTPFKGE